MEEAALCPDYMHSLLHGVPERPKGIQGKIFGDGLAVGVAGKFSVLTANRHQSYTPSFP